MRYVSFHSSRPVISSIQSSLSILLIRVFILAYYWDIRLISIWLGPPYAHQWTCSVCEVSVCIFALSFSSEPGGLTQAGCWYWQSLDIVVHGLGQFDWFLSGSLGFLVSKDSKCPCGFQLTGSCVDGHPPQYCQAVEGLNFGVWKGSGGFPDVPPLTKLLFHLSS